MKGSGRLASLPIFYYIFKPPNIMRKIWLFCIMCVCLQVKAQQLYVGGNVGYGLSLANQIFDEGDKLSTKTQLNAAFFSGKIGVAKAFDKSDFVLAGELTYTQRQSKLYANLAGRELEKPFKVHSLSVQMRPIFRAGKRFSLTLPMGVSLNRFDLFNQITLDNKPKSKLFYTYYSEKAQVLGGQAGLGIEYSLGKDAEYNMDMGVYHGVKLGAEVLFTSFFKPMQYLDISYSPDGQVYQRGMVSSKAQGVYASLYMIISLGQKANKRPKNPVKKPVKKHRFVVPKD